MALLAKLAADGVRLESLPGGKLRATGNLTDAVRTLIRMHKPKILAELIAANDAPCRHWRIAYANGAAMLVVFHPAAAQSEVAELYPGASIEPLPDAPTRAATPAEAAELRALIGAIMPDDIGADRAEALAVARGDPDTAMVCYRALVAGAGGRSIPCHAGTETARDRTRA